MFNTDLVDVREPEAFSAEYAEQQEALKVLAITDAKRVEFLVNEFHFTEEEAFQVVFSK